jgi:hypothetical protein
MQSRFEDFLKKPSRETFMAVRAAVVSSGAYNPYGNALEQASKLLDEGLFAEFLEQMPRLMPDHLLSPRAHMMASFAYKQLADEEGRKFEMALAHLCIDGVLASGDGSREKPYFVLRVSDEYDVMGALGRQMKQQSLVREGARALDAMDCADGTRVFFDITDMFSLLGKSIGA